VLFTRYAAAFSAAAPWFAAFVALALCAVLVAPTCAFLTSDEAPVQAAFAASFEQEGETVAPAPGPVSAPAEDAEDESPELEESLPCDGSDRSAPWPESRPLLRAHALDLHPESQPRPDARPPEVA
jgi:hypothetical protein